MVQHTTKGYKVQHLPVLHANFANAKLLITSSVVRKTAARQKGKNMIADFMWCFRHTHNYSTRKLAEWLGVSAATICRIECGKPVSQDVFIKLIRFMFENSKSGGSAYNKRQAKTVAVNKRFLLADGHRIGHA